MPLTQANAYSFNNIPHFQGRRCLPASGLHEYVKHQKYALVARKQFRAAVMQKLTTLGIEADKRQPAIRASKPILATACVYGQFSLDKSLASRRERLVKRAESRATTCWWSTSLTPV